MREAAENGLAYTVVRPGSLTDKPRPKDASLVSRKGFHEIVRGVTVACDSNVGKWCTTQYSYDPVYTMSESNKIDWLRRNANT